MGREVGYHLLPLLEVVADARKAVALQNTLHHLAIHHQRKIELSVVNYRRPMLISDGVTKLEERLKVLLQGELLQPREVDDKHLAQTQPYDQRLASLGIEPQDISVAQALAPLQSYGNSPSGLTEGHKAASLGTPLVELQVVGPKGCQPLGPGVVVAVAHHRTDNIGSHQLNQ